MGQDSFSLMAMQSYALDRLQYRCVNDNGACVGVQIDIHLSKDMNGDKTRDTAFGVNMGYGFDNGLSVGLSLGHSTNRKLPNSYRHDKGGVGIGGVVRYQAPNGYFGEISGAYDNYTATITRPTLANTELGVNEADIKGVAYGIKVGQSFNKDNENLNVYVGAKHRDIRRDAYTENDNTAFPISYGKMQYKQTVAIAGLNSKIGINDKLSWIGDMQIEQRLSGDNPTYTASLTGIEKYEFAHTIIPVKTQGYVAVGLQHQFIPKTHASFSPYITKNATGEISKGAMLRLETTF